MHLEEATEHLVGVDAPVRTADNGKRRADDAHPPFERGNLRIESLFLIAVLVQNVCNCRCVQVFVRSQ